MVWRSLSKHARKRRTGRRYGEYQQRLETIRNEQDDTRKIRKNKRSSVAFASVVFRFFTLSALICFLLVWAFVVSVIFDTVSRKPGEATTAKGSEYGNLGARGNVRAPRAGVDVPEEALADSGRPASPPLDSIYHIGTPCVYTAVLFDPKLPTYPADHVAYTRTLDSFVSMLQLKVGDGTESKEDWDGACLTLHTSSCNLDGLAMNDAKDVVAMGTDGKLKQRDDRFKAASLVYSKLTPNTREFADSGRIRLATLSHTKYKYRGCDDWEKNPTKALSDIRYFNDEFTDLDSQMHLLFFESGVLFCNKFYLDRWRDVAYVGAPWLKGAGYMATFWPMWAKVGRTFVQYWSEKDATGSLDDEYRWITLVRNGSLPVEEIAKQPLPHTQFEPLPPKESLSLNGNDRLTLLNLKWIKRAILTCPQRRISGLPNAYVDQLNCSVPGRPDSEMYYSTVLRGINAPIPVTTFEGSLFAVKFQWPEEMDIEDEVRNDAIRRRWGEEGVRKYDEMARGLGGKQHVVPVGILPNMRVSSCEEIGFAPMRARK